MSAVWVTEDALMTAIRAEVHLDAEHGYPANFTPRTLARLLIAHMSAAGGAGMSRSGGMTELAALREVANAIARGSIPRGWGAQKYRRHVLQMLDDALLRESDR